VLFITEATKDFVAPMLVLEFSLEDSVSSNVLLRVLHNGLGDRVFHLTVLGLVLANFGSVSFTGVTSSPAFAACGAERGRLDLAVSFLLPLSLLHIEWNEETASCLRSNSLATSIKALMSSKLATLSLCNLLHFRFEIVFVLFAQKETEIVDFLVVLLSEVEFLLVTRCVIEAEMLGNGTLTRTGNHWQGGS
jgi:hypothetical protein